MKKAMDRVRPRLGDVIEVPLPNGDLRYVHFVKEHCEPPGYGSLLRVLPGGYQRRPANLEQLAEQKELYFVFFPLGAACNRKFVKIVASAPVPAHLVDDWPVFRSANENFDTGRKTWFLWDFKKWHQIGNLLPEHHDLSLLQVLNLTALEERLTSGWMPSDEV